MSTRNVGRYLGVCLSSLVLLAPTTPSSAFEPSRVVSVLHGTVSISSREGARYRQSVSIRAVLEVRAVVEAELSALPDGSLTTVTLRDTLSGLYGSRMQESSTAMGYSLVWDGTRWVVVCTSLSSFAIDFGPQGTVVVEARDVTTY